MKKGTKKLEKESERGIQNEREKGMRVRIPVGKNEMKRNLGCAGYFELR